MANMTTVPATMATFESMSDGGKIEILRDLCGGFHEFSNISREEFNSNLEKKNCYLLYMIPSATKGALNKDKRTFGCYCDEDVHRASNQLMLEGITLIHDEKPALYDAIVESLTGGTQLTSQNVIDILDLYYVDNVPAAVELYAIRELQK